MVLFMVNAEKKPRKTKLKLMKQKKGSRTKVSQHICREQQSFQSDESKILKTKL
jgi:hypothetical protein